MTLWQCNMHHYFRVLPVIHCLNSCILSITFAVKKDNVLLVLIKCLHNNVLLPWIN